MSDSEHASPFTDTPAPQDSNQPRTSGPVRSLEQDQHYGSGPRLKDLDAEIERELQEAMGGMSEKEMYGDPEKQRGKAPAGEPGKKVARVLRVHGPDVFLDVP